MVENCDSAYHIARYLAEVDMAEAATSNASHVAHLHLASLHRNALASSLMEEAISDGTFVPAPQKRMSQYAHR